MPTLINSAPFKNISKIAILTTLLSIGVQAPAALVDKVAATVNSNIILHSDLLRFAKTHSLRREVDPLFNLFDGINVEKPEKSIILDFLIQEELISQSFHVQDSEVDQEVKNVMKGNNLSQDQLATFLESKGFSYDDYFEIMRVGLQKKKSSRS